MSQDQSVTAFIIKSQDLSEADILLTFFSDSEGKVRAVVKSAKKMTSKLSGNLQPYNLVQVTLAGNGGLPKVINVLPIERYTAVVRHQAAMHAVVAMQELVLRSLADGQPNLSLYEIYRRAMGELNSNPDSATLILTMFYAQSLAVLGFTPRLLELDPPPENQTLYFSLAGGNFSLKAAAEFNQALTQPAYRLLQTLLTQPQTAAGFDATIPYSDGSVREVLALLTKFAGFQLERELRAPLYFTVI